MNKDDQRRVDRLRDAAERLGGLGPRDDAVDIEVYPPPPGQPKLAGLPQRMVLPAAVARPMAVSLLAAAERIEMVGWSLGQPVSYQLEIAGVIVGEDLGHNR
ncbi:hypothetical protein [Pseudonocardia sp. NPDC049635]|uniref:hypothetical protein n=1 Tax=Pseudonocardia sp. NPDC049635 TaxID=3155506 RepID=UPI0033E401D4